MGRPADARMIVWAGGAIAAGLSAWLFLTQPFPLDAAAFVWAAVAWVAWRSAGRPGLAGVAVGTGAAGAGVSIAAAGPDEVRLAWLVASLALIGIGSFLTILLRRAPAPERLPGPPRRPTVRLAVTIVVIGVVALGCVGMPVRPGEYPIRTTAIHLWVAPCGGVGLDAVVRGSPTDPDVVWLENRMPRMEGSEWKPRLQAKWPAGYRARFTPALEILDGFGIVVARDGDLVDGSCSSSEPLYVDWSVVHRP